MKADIYSILPEHSVKLMLKSQYEELSIVYNNLSANTQSQL